MNQMMNLQKRSSPGQIRPVRSSGGFTLVELLVTIAIMAILSLLILPSFTGLTTSSKFNTAIGDLSETLNLARQAAVSQNTYVWVAFALPTSTSNQPLSSLMVASVDGTNPFRTNWATSIELPDSRFQVISKRMSYPQCQFVESGVLTATQIPSLPERAATTVNALASDLSFKINSSTGTMTYNRVLAFSPSGMVYNGPNPVTFVEFGLRAGVLPGATGTSPNVICFRLPFITGRTEFYRP